MMLALRRQYTTIPVYPFTEWIRKNVQGAEHVRMLVLTRVFSSMEFVHESVIFAMVARFVWKFVSLRLCVGLM
jgi:hypothetical protein